MFIYFGPENGQNAKQAKRRSEHYFVDVTMFECKLVQTFSKLSFVPNREMSDPNGAFQVTAGLALGGKTASRNPKKIPLWLTWGVNFEPSSMGVTLYQLSYRGAR
jgi:hypothetical protein